MRLGLSSFIYRYATSPTRSDAPPMSAATMLRRAYALGVDAVQFSDNLPLHLLDDGALAALRDLGGELGLAIEVGARGLDRGLLERYVALAGFFGSRALRLVLDEADPGRARAGLVWLLPRLQDAGLPLAIENHGMLPVQTLAAIVSELDDPLLGFCVDTANNLILLERPLETVAALAPRAIQLHLKDYIVEKAPVGYRMTGRVLGEGSLDIAAVLGLVQPVERGLDVYLESWMDPAPTWGETLLQEEQWIAQCIERARWWLGRQQTEETP
jgi:3-oxoisoapionate decarboxylase